MATTSTQHAPRFPMRRPEGVVANARSETRLATVPSLSSMALKGPQSVYCASPAAEGGGGAGQGSDGGGASRLTDRRAPYPRSYMRVAMHHASVLGLTPEQMLRITGGRPQSSATTKPWKHEDRWEAQAITDFLYLAPAKVATNRAFLQQHKISKMISIRDSRFADVRMLHYDQFARSLGIEMECFDVPAATANGLVAAIPRVVHSINSHMLAAPVDDVAGSSLGRVLVFCETGNIRSAAVVLAYLMSMYGESMQDCWRFVTQKRFCASLDNDTRQMLVAYEELFRARLDVQRGKDQAAAAAETEANSTPSSSGNMDMDVDGDGSASPIILTPSASGSERGDSCRPSRVSPSNSNGNGNGLLSAKLAEPRSRSAKRSIDETMDVDDDRIELTRPDGSGGAVSRESSAEPSSLNLDYARYENRGSFAPFSDLSLVGSK